MKKLIYGLYGAFLVLMGATFYAAYTVDDGLVEEHYYEKAAAFFGAKQGQDPSRAPDCEIDKGACSKEVGGDEVTIDITPKPVKAMQELVFHLTFRRNSPSGFLATAGGGGVGGLPGEFTLDLSMPGMYMGMNRVLLRRTSGGTYSGKGVIPKCRSGKRLWKATVALPQEGQVGFTFNVSY
ncbi:MAG: FixH family protein [Nitrospirae bacterium]|nr:FixH family protein [Nitrospirota bacterium]